ncbi:unnamed protein product [Urochloa decumbens]|uniref:F-box domain-containing protein n=1 Tax=Urochloa decumbens TaxID=240449 RepID=A0ABC8Y2B0_9POAL
MPPRKRRRTCATAPSPAPALPADLLLEIAARSDARTIFRCSATCKLLRRAILRPGFVRHVVSRGPPDDEAVVPPSILGALGETFTFVHPIATASCHFERHLVAYLSRSAAGLLEEYAPLASRRGLVVLGRRESETNRRRRSSESERRRRQDLCVYDPLTDGRTFLPVPPDIGRDGNDHPYRGLHGDVTVFARYVLLTAADGIGCSFMLLAADMTKNLDCSSRIRVQTVYDDDAVVIGGVVHWLMHIGDSFVRNIAGKYILTYDVKAATVGSVDLPDDWRRGNDVRGFTRSQLLASPDGTKLSFIGVDRLVLSIWVLASSSGGSWALHAVVDMKAWPWDFQPWEERRIRLANFGDQRSGVVFLRCGVDQGLLYGLDMEKKATYYQTLDLDEDTGIPYEVDLASRLSSMKAF